MIKVRHITARKFDHNAFHRHPKNRTIVPKIMLVSDHYVRVMLAEILFLNPRYHPNDSESPKLKTQHFNIIVLLLKATNNNAENLKCVKHVNTSIVCQ